MGRNSDPKPRPTMATRLRADDFVLAMRIVPLTCLERCVANGCAARHWAAPSYESGRCRFFTRFARESQTRVGRTSKMACRVRLDAPSFGTSLVRPDAPYDALRTFP